MKGKKFDAAEAHFSKLLSTRDKEIKRLSESLTTLRADLSAKNSRISSLEEENRVLKEWVDRLLEYTELSKEDIKSACERDKNSSYAMNLISTMITSARYL